VYIIIYNKNSIIAGCFFAGYFNDD